MKDDPLAGCGFTIVAGIIFFLVCCSLFTKQVLVPGWIWDSYVAETNWVAVFFFTAIFVLIFHVIVNKLISWSSSPSSQPFTESAQENDEGSGQPGYGNSPPRASGIYGTTDSAGNRTYAFGNTSGTHVPDRIRVPNGATNATEKPGKSAPVRNQDVDDDDGGTTVASGDDDDDDKDDEVDGFAWSPHHSHASTSTHHHAGHTSSHGSSAPAHHQDSGSSGGGSHHHGSSGSSHDGGNHDPGVDYSNY